MGEENEILGDGIEDISVQHEVVSGGRFVNEFLDDRKRAELHRQESVQDVVVIAAQVDNLELVFVDSIEDEPKEFGMSLRP